MLYTLQRVFSASLTDQYDPAAFPVGKHKMVQLHEPSGQLNMYVGNHIYTIEGMSHKESQAELEPLLAHLSQPKYVASVGYENVGDLVIWDNTCVV